MTSQANPIPAAERKRLQRQRDRAAGWVEITVKVAANQVDAVRDFVGQLPAPEAPTDPAQLDLLACLDRKLQEGRK